MHPSSPGSIFEPHVLEIRLAQVAPRFTPLAEKETKHVAEGKKKPTIHDGSRTIDTSCSFRTLILVVPSKLFFRADPFFQDPENSVGDSDQWLEVWVPPRVQTSGDCSAVTAAAATKGGTPPWERSESIRGRYGVRKVSEMGFSVD